MRRSFSSCNFYRRCRHDDCGGGCLRFVHCLQLLLDQIDCAVGKLFDRGYGFFVPFLNRFDGLARSPATQDTQDNHVGLGTEFLVQVRQRSQGQFVGSSIRFGVLQDLQKVSGGCRAKIRIMSYRGWFRSTAAVRDMAGATA